MSDHAVIGRPLLRKEDRRFLTGRGQFLDDVAIPGALHAHFLRSPHPHARIVSINSDAARRLSGVYAVATGRELAAWTTPLRLAPPIEGLLPVECTTLPIDKVRFVGDPVACIVAVDRYIAEDAAALIEVVYEMLPPVPNIERALAPDAPRVDESLPGNLVSHQTFSAGDPTRRFAQAAVVVEASFHQHRQTHAPIETRGCGEFPSKTSL